VLAPPNLLRAVAIDAPYISSFLAQRTSGPVVLVGHSYGGFVITNAATGVDAVKALVYVDAFIPDEGENVFQILGGSGSAFDIPDPTAVFDLVGYPGAPEGDAGHAAPHRRARGRHDHRGGRLPRVDGLASPGHHRRDPGGRRRRRRLTRVEPCRWDVHLGLRRRRVSIVAAHGRRRFRHGAAH
jgi:pimeloyl-ACP methyl ester carboxylesterase